MIYELAGTYLTPQTQTRKVWNETAQALFTGKRELMWPRFQDTLERRQLYDKMIIDCAFKQDLKRRIEPNLKGGCDEFYFSLTTNGLCYTFNGKNQRDLWEPSEALDVLMENYPQGEADKNFGGSGAVQGKTEGLSKDTKTYYNPTILHNIQ